MLISSRAIRQHILKANKSYPFFLAIALLSITALFLGNSEPVSGACAACDGVELCPGFDACCSSVSDGICPQNYGGWSAEGCTAGCNNEDEDCCIGPNMSWSPTGWLSMPDRDPYNLGRTSNLCCGNDPGEELVTNVGEGNPPPFDQFACCPPSNGTIVYCGDEGMCGKDASSGGREECSYLGNCDGVNAKPNLCFDGIDNDCDDHMDFCDGVNIICPINAKYPGEDRRDAECVGRVIAEVSIELPGGNEGDKLIGATVKAIKRGSLIYKNGTYNPQHIANTDGNGIATLIVNGNMSYDLIASAPGFAPKTIPNVYVGYQEVKVNFTFLLRPSATECNDDCTTLSAPLCNPDCDNWGGCNFVNAIVKNQCEGKQPGFKVQYISQNDEQMEVLCCEGTPYIVQQTAQLDKKVRTDKANLVRVVKPIIMDGEQVNMIIDVFS